jgi:hypothetical protein
MRNSLKLAIFLTLLSCLGRSQVVFNPRGEQLKAPPSTSPPDQLCVIAGRATDTQSGQPLRKVSVRLIRRNSGTRVGTVGAPSSEEGYAATSDFNGNFRFENVEPGEYALSGQRLGYLRTEYGSKRASGPGTTFSLRPGQQLTSLALLVLPQSVITGKVVDDDGDPLNGVSIQVLNRRWMRGKLRLLPQSNASSNDLGEFRLANLAPGKYYLAAQMVHFQGESTTISGKIETRPVRTFYPEAMNLETATPIEVKAGQDIPGINIRMHSVQTYHIRGRISGLSADERTDHMSVNISARGEESFTQFGPQPGIITKERTFEITGVPPGSYYLSIYSMGGRVRSLAHQEIDVGSADVNDVVLNVIPSTAMHGHVALAGAPPAGTAAVDLTSIHISLTSTENFMSGTNAQVKEDGSLVIENVLPGKYALNIFVPWTGQSGAYVKSVRLGQQEIQRRELDLTNGASGQVEIILSYGTAELSGSVQNTQAASEAPQGSQSASPASPAQIVLLPDTLNADGSGYYVGTLTSAGTFSIKQVAPGRYHAYAFEDVNIGDLQNPDLAKALENRGIEVELGQGEQKQVQLSAISTDQYQQLLARLGIEPQ